jgi:hypothetical protein
LDVPVGEAGDTHQSTLSLTLWWLFVMIGVVVVLL